MSAEKKPIEISKHNGFKKMWDTGFTLLEVMLSVSIIAIVLVSVYKMQAQTISMNYISEYQTTAALLAQRKMAEAEITPSGLLVSDSGNFGEEFKGYGWNVTVEKIESEFLGDVASDLRKVDVTISLNQNENVYRISEYRFIRD